MKRGMIFSGGGAKGAFGVGVLNYLRGAGLYQKPDMLCGTSTGSLIAAMIGAELWPQLTSLYQNMNDGRFGVPQDIVSAIVHGSLFNDAALVSIINNTFSEAIWQQISASSTQLVFATVNMQRSETTYFYTGPAPITMAPNSVCHPITSRAQFVEVLTASANEPAFTPQVRIDGYPYDFCDGGVHEIAPIKILLENDCTEVIAVIFSPTFPVEQHDDQGNLQRYPTLPATIMRTIDMFCDDVLESNVRITNAQQDFTNYRIKLFQSLLAYFQQHSISISEGELETLFNISLYPHFTASDKEIHITYVRPDAGDQLLDFALSFTEDQMQQIIAKGFNKAAEVFGNTEPPVATESIGDKLDEVV